MTGRPDGPLLLREEQRLVEGLLAGNDDAVRELYARYARPVFTLGLRLLGSAEAAEELTQDVFLAAWRKAARFDPSRGRLSTWLMTIAHNLAVDRLRRETGVTRPHLVLVDEVPETPTPDEDEVLMERDVAVRALASLSDAERRLLARAYFGGLTAREIARAFLVPEATMAQRISRAKQRIRDSGGRFTPPRPEERPDRLEAVLHVLYLIFNEGSTASSGPSLHRVELSAEAIRLTRQLRELLPDDGEVAGLLALMLLTDARRPARTRPDGSLVPLAEQDRDRWDGEAIAEGTRLVEWALTTTPIGPFQLQAAIAALHDEARRAEDTDWRQILALYELLESIDPGPMVTLNRVVALAMVRGPEEGLRALRDATADPALARHYRTDAVRAHLLELAGETEGAIASYRRAARRTLSIPERRYLLSRASRLG
jgi:RNA polymerase sigma factor (sigma-70 family)